MVGRDALELGQEDGNFGLMLIQISFKTVFQRGSCEITVSLSCVLTLV